MAAAYMDVIPFLYEGVESTTSLYQCVREDAKHTASFTRRRGGGGRFPVALAFSQFQRSPAPGFTQTRVGSACVKPGAFCWWKNHYFVWHSYVTFPFHFYFFLLFFILFLPFSILHSHFLSPYTYPFLFMLICMQIWWMSQYLYLLSLLFS